jgi:uncharacterized protein with HEPN domain
MRHDSSASLADILQAAKLIRNFAERRHESSEDELYAAAVARQFVIIGEDLVRVRDKDPDTFSKIDDGRKIIAFRNLLVHSYESIETDLLFANTEKPLDRLVHDVESMIGEAEED